jgi:DNA invertase Pin-like site-specific DNA recombinase
MEEIKRAAGYIRVSTAEQVQKKLSLENQAAEIEAYCKAHNMRLVGLYIDRGITARKSLHKRTEFMRMMHDVEAGEVNHVVVLRLDRFFRNVYDYHKMMNEYLTPNNCDWSAVKEQYTTATTNGRLMINLRLSIAEQECDTDSDRIKDVLDHRAKQGYAITGEQPFGLKVENKRVVKDPENNHIAKALFDTFEAVNSKKKAMEIVNETYGTKLFYNTVSKILKNPLYYGCYRGMEDYCEATVTKEQFFNVQRLLKMNVRKRGNRRTYIFSKLLVCDHCGNSMPGNNTTVHGKAYGYYRCNKSLISKQCDNKISIREENLEQYLLDNVEKLLEEYIVSVAVEEKQTKPKKNNRAAIEKKMQRLNDLYINGFIDMEKYKNDYAELQSSIVDEPEKTAKKDLAAVKNFLQGDFKTIYSTLSAEEKQTLWRSVIKEIRVFGKDIVDIKFL